MTKKRRSGRTLTCTLSQTKSWKISNFLTYTLFIALLKKHFKAYNRERQGVYKLNTIKQGNQPVEELVTEFSLYIAEAGLTSDTNAEQVMLIEKFRLALNPSLAK